MTMAVRPLLPPESECRTMGRTESSPSPDLRRAIGFFTVLRTCADWVMSWLLPSLFCLVCTCSLEYGDRLRFRILPKDFLASSNRSARSWTK